MGKEVGEDFSKYKQQYNTINKTILYLEKEENTYLHTHTKTSPSLLSYSTILNLYNDTLYTIIKQLQAGGVPTPVVFPDSKGFHIGNAVIHDETDTKGMYEYFWTHALISDQVKNEIMSQCEFSPKATNQTEACNSATDYVDVDTHYLDIYNIYAPVCQNSNLTAKPKQPSQIIHPCSDYYVYNYLNSPEVQKALHANVTKMSHDWEPCSDIITKWGDSPTTIIPLLREFMAKGIRVWIFSGDTDGRVPVTSTKASLNVTRLPTKTKWHAWYIKGEVGGYTQEYEGNLTFATVRGAGHQVPSYQPVRALAMIMHFLGGTPLPDTTRKSLY